ncbi:hypothetical protein PMAYCL1PPCAC_24590, partial [Pristionchus mayeri]
KMEPQASSSLSVVEKKEDQDSASNYLGTILIICGVVLVCSVIGIVVIIKVIQHRQTIKNDRKREELMAAAANFANRPKEVVPLISKNEIEEEHLSDRPSSESAKDKSEE